MSQKILVALPPDKFTQKDHRQFREYCHDHGLVMGHIAANLLKTYMSDKLEKGGDA